MTSNPTFWILARASGLLAYALLTASVLAGIVLKARPFGRALRPAGVTDLHRFLALLGLAALALHGVTLVLDDAVEIAPTALVVPGLVPYRPLWTALGVLAGELMLLVYASFSLRKRIGNRAWRRLHWLTYVVFALATVHGLAAGSDSHELWALIVYGGAAGAVLAAAAWRALLPPIQGGRARTPDPDRPRPASLGARDRRLGQGERHGPGSDGADADAAVAQPTGKGSSEVLSRRRPTTRGRPCPASRRLRRRRDARAAARSTSPAYLGWRRARS